MSNGPWTDEDNDLIVADYFAMLADDIAGQPVVRPESKGLDKWNFLGKMHVEILNEDKQIH